MSDRAHDRLYYEHIDKSNRLQRLRELHEQKEVHELLMIQQQMRRVGTEDEAKAIFAELYMEADRRRQKVNQLRQMEDERWLAAAVIPKRNRDDEEEEGLSKKSDKVHYERLYEEYQKRLEKLEKERKQKETYEIKAYEAKKLHQDVLGEGDDPKEVVEEMVDRLYSDHGKRQRKLEKKREDAQEEEKKANERLQVAGDKKPAEEIMTICDRLFKDAKNRRDKIEKELEEQDKKRAADRETAGLPAKGRMQPSRESHVQVHARLYDEAAKRKAHIEAEHQKKIDLEIQKVKRDNIHKDPDTGESRRKKLSELDTTLTKRLYPEGQEIRHPYQGFANKRDPGPLIQKRLAKERAAAEAQSMTASPTSPAGPEEDSLGPMPDSMEKRPSMQRRASAWEELENMLGGLGESGGGPKAEDGRRASQVTAPRGGTQSGRDQRPSISQGRSRGSIMGTPDMGPRQSISGQPPAIDERRASRLGDNFDGFSGRSRASLATVDEADVSRARASIARASLRGPVLDIGGQLEDLEVVLAAEEGDEYADE